MTLSGGSLYVGGRMQPIAPPPLDPAEWPRWKHTRLRRRLLYSEHERDLNERLREQLKHVRADAWGKPDLTANPFLSLWSQMSRLYAESPQITAPEGSEGLLVTLEAAGVWPLMQRVQRDTLALREMLLRTDPHPGLTEDDPHHLVKIPVFPDLVEATVTASNPKDPVAISELFEHSGKWYRLQTDISDLHDPFRRVVDVNSGRDVTEQVFGHPVQGGEAYPYRYADGQPFLNYVTYHAAESGRQWDWSTLREVVEGSLNIGVGMTYYWHIIRNAAWAQRWSVGVEWGGGELGNDDPSETRRTRVADPATVIEGEPNSEGVQPSVGQWSSPADPEAVLRSVFMYEDRILVLAGLSPPGVGKQEADIRSGYSLTVQREAAREHQRLYEPMFRRGDQEQMAKDAALLNRANGTSYSETPADYRISYRGLAPSPVEQRSLRDSLYTDLDRGMVSPEEVYIAIHPGSTIAEASAALAYNAQRRRLYEVEQGEATDDAAPAVADEKADQGEPAAAEPDAAEPDGREENAASKAVALNGAQVTSAVGIVQEVAMGRLPRDVGLSMLEAFLGLDGELAGDVMGSVGAGFKIESTEV